VRESDRLQFLLQELKSQVYPVSALPAANSSDRGETPLALPGSATQPTLLPTSTSADPSLMGAIPLDSVLDPLITAAQAIAEDRDLHLSYTGLTIASPIQGSINPLRETLSNLIDNALKYTPAGGFVKIQWLRPAEHPGWQWVVISDSGPGIPEADLPHLFQRHYRGVQAQGEIPGTGLGLALARQWIEQMGGRLEVISPAGIWRPEGEGGVGAAFRVWLKESGGSLA
jgi:signal transduction histidine kinase